MFKKRGTISCSLTIVRKCFVLGLGHCVFGSNRFVSNSLHSIFAGRWLFSLLPFVRLLLIILVFFFLRLTLASFSSSSRISRCVSSPLPWHQQNVFHLSAYLCQIVAVTRINTIISRWCIIDNQPEEWARVLQTHTEREKTAYANKFLTIFSSLCSWFSFDKSIFQLWCVSIRTKSAPA